MAASLEAAAVVDVTGPRAGHAHPPPAKSLKRRKGTDGPAGTVIRARPEPAASPLLVPVEMEGLLQKRAETTFLHPMQHRYFVLLLGDIQELRYYHRVIETRFGNCPAGGCVSLPLASITDIEVPASGPTATTFVLHASVVKISSFPRSALLGDVVDGRKPRKLSREQAARMRAGGAVEPASAVDEHGNRRPATLSTMVTEHRVYNLSAASVDDRARWVDALRRACPHTARPVIEA